MTKDQKLNFIWKRTHPQYRSIWKDRKAIMVFRNGTKLVLLQDLTDAEIAARMPKTTQA